MKSKAYAKLRESRFDKLKNLSRNQNFMFFNIKNTVHPPIFGRILGVMKNSSILGHQKSDVALYLLSEKFSTTSKFFVTKLTFGSDRARRSKVSSVTKNLLAVENFSLSYYGNSCGSFHEFDQIASKISHFDK